MMVRASPEQRKHLFQPFVRGDSARSTSGTGPGLAIVQRIIDNHNGMLEIGTSERGGLSIRARLPVPFTRAQGITKDDKKAGGEMPPLFVAVGRIRRNRHPALFVTASVRR